MKTTVGLFASRSDAEDAVARLRAAGVPPERINMLSPGAPERDLRRVPTTDTEQPGVGPALGGVVGAAAGAAGGIQAAVAGKGIEAPASFSRHGTLVSAQLDLLRDVAQATGMSLDAEPVTHHAISATLEDLPRLTEALGQLRARGATALQKQAATPEDKARIEALATMARLFDQNARHAFEQLGRADDELRRLVQHWYLEVSDMLAYLADTVAPRGFDAITADDFACVREMLGRQGG